MVYCPIYLGLYAGWTDRIEGYMWDSVPLILHGTVGQDGLIG